MTEPISVGTDERFVMLDGRSSRMTLSTLRGETLTKTEHQEVLDLRELLLQLVSEWCECDADDSPAAVLGQDVVF
ncbi:hypothetical protein [Mycobacteroides chelonae]|uniref:hypothetical protein n=1 Tax=Mycobacteroides chelonae TaxID=1774 RepID=UPI001042325D|nr:hypothetical protein [Mycobacteroides chelonae]